MASGNDSWNTPPELFDPALSFVGKYFDLDPFSNPTSIVPARVRFIFPQYGICGLTAKWKGSCWVNGPWSKQRKVVEKCVAEALQGAEIFLVQPVTGASYLGHILRTPARCYLHKRPQFLKDGKPFAGSNRTDVVLVYRGPRVWQFREAYRHLGEVER